MSGDAPSGAQPSLVAFLSARLDEDERLALDTPGLGEWEVQGHHVVDPAAPKSLGPVAAFAIGGAAHVARHDPARVLREVEAKRAILAMHRTAGYWAAGTLSRQRYWCSCGDAEPCQTARQLAAIYSSHPDYQPEWKP